MKLTWLSIVLVAGSLSVAVAFDKAGDALTSARQKLSKKDYAGARADTAAAAALAMTSADKSNVTILQAQIADSSGDPGKALEIYAGVLAVPDLSPQVRANTHVSVGRIYERQANWVAARAAYDQCLAVEKLPDSVRLTTLGAIASTFQKEPDLPGMKKAVAAIDDSAAKTPALRDYALLATAKNESGEALAAWQQIVALPEVPAKNYSEAVFRALDLLAALDRTADAGKFIEQVAGNSQLSAGERYQCRLITAGLHKPELSPAIVAAIPKDSVTAEMQVTALRNAGKFFMAARQYSIVRTLAALADGMYRQEPKKIYHCRYTEKAPTSVEAWVASSVLASPQNLESHFEEYDRKAAALLINDVNVERAVTEAGLAADKKTAFAMTYDDDGWRIFVECEDSQAEKVWAGLLGGGQLEMSFAPGLGVGYYQWFFHFPKPDFKSISWDSPNRHFRTMEPYCVADTGLVNGGFGASLFIPWELVYDRLPAEGDAWPFNVIRWTRAGGVTWHGRVHAIHDFGRVQWEGLTPERLLGIKRKLVMKGFGNYQKSRRDLVAFWKDEVLGDPAFYQQAVQPVVEKLDASGKKVDPKMTTEDVTSLFAEAVPDWMEFSYKVAELRRVYLAAKLVHAE